MDEKLYSNEIQCCGDNLMEVKLPETLICTECGKSYMNLVTGVDRSKIIKKEESNEQR